MKGLILRSNNYKYALIIIILCFLVYGNSIQNGYSLDDHLVNDKNELTQHGIKGFKEIFSSYSFKEKEYNYEYRPVLLLSFAIEYSVFGTNPHVSHFISILLFALFGFLLFRFFIKNFPETSPGIIFCGIILFIVHPIHSEAVDNIKSRDELLTAIFGISMLIQLGNYLKDKKIIRILVAMLFILLGFLTKETILIYVVLAPVLIMINNKKSKINYRIFILLVLSFIVVLVGIKLGKIAALPQETYHRDYLFYENPLYKEHFISRIPAALSITLYYFKLLVWPFDLSFYYGYNEVEISTWKNFLPYVGILFYAGLIYLSIKLFRKDRLLSFSIILFLVNVFAVCGIFKSMPGIVGERFIFLGSAGFSICLALMLFRLFEKYKWTEKIKSDSKINFKGISLVAVLLIIQSASIYSRNKVWKDEFALIQNDAEHMTNSAKVQDMAAFQLLREIYAEPDSPDRTRLMKEAEEHSLRCLEIYPDYINSLNNLGTLYFIEKNYSESEKYYRKGLKLEPGNANVLFNLATIYEQRNSLDTANEFYEKALISNPDLPNLIPFYKQFVVKSNKQDTGIAFVRGILRTFPLNYELYLLITDLYDEKHDYKNALFYVREAYKINPNTELAKFIGALEKLNKK